MEDHNYKTSSAVKTYTEKGKSYLHEAVKNGSKNNYHLAIQEFVLAYKHALLLNNDRAVEVSCLFNLGAAYIAAEYYSRGIDVLGSILSNGAPLSGNGPSKGDILFNIGCAHDKMKQYDDAIRYYHDALSEYRLTSVTFSPMLCETLVNLGKVYSIKGDKIQAGDLFNNAAQRYFEQNMLERGCDALLEKISTMVSESKIIDSECRPSLHDCLEKTKKIEEQNVRGRLLNEIGLKLTLISEYEEALDCFKKSLQLCSSSNPEQKAHILQNIGAVYNRIEQYQTAITFHTQSIAVHGELGKRNAQGQCFCNLAYAQSQLRDYESAKESYNHALLAFKDTGDKNGEWQVYEGLGAVALLYNRPDGAVLFYQLALKCQAQSKDYTEQAQDRLIQKLTLTLQAQLKQNFVPRLQSHQSDRSLSTRRSLTNKNTLPTLPSNSTEVDAPISLPRPPSRGKKSSKQQLVIADDVIVPKQTQSVEESLPQIKPDLVKVKKRQFNRGRRGYERGEDRPFVQVARGLSSLTELSFGTLEFEDSDLESFDGDNTFAKFDSTLSFRRSNEEDGFHTYQSVPATIQYMGMLYSPAPPSMQHVSQNIQNVSRMSRKWKKNGTRSAGPRTTGARTSTLFEEPLAEELPEQRPQSAASRPASAGGILKKRPRPRSKKATDLSEDRSRIGGLSLSEDSDSESEQFDETDYAGRYKEQLRTVDEEAEKEEDARSSSSSSSSSSSDEEEGFTPVSTNSEVPKTSEPPLNSMPVRTVPHPPKKPPRKGRTYEKPLQGPNVQDDTLYSQSAKKSIRFAPEVRDLEAGDHTYQSLNTNSAARPNDGSGDAENESGIYETVEEQNESTSSFDSFGSSPPLSSLKLQQPVPPINLSEEDGRENGVREYGNPSDDPLHIPSRNEQKKRKSHVCRIM